MRRPSQAPSRRAGFTLVELLVVILIIAILVALLVPAIAAAVRAANNARVSAEISNLQTALADFKSKYGEYPPSRILLLSNAPGGNVFYNTSLTTPLSGANDMTLGDLYQRTVRAMRKFFPRAGGYFNTSGAITPIDWDGPNFNGSGVLLQGHECLAFFLGGMPEQTVDSSGAYSYFMSGFSRDPQNPFNRSSVSPNRTQPLFEFSPGRLQDAFSLSLANAAGGPNGFPSYIDPLSNSSDPHPYAYFSSYGNNSYDPNDDNSAAVGNNGGSIETDESGTTPVGRSFLLGNSVIVSGAPNPYTNGNPITALVGVNTHAPVSWVNPQTFQLISAGGDGQWGYGGGYEATSNEKLPTYPNDTIQPTVRVRERDNVTNFTGGKIE
jgi:prepilin-type N-terminal cleavage/methylation domain-containing protein